jgi:hypothetical protein
MRHRAVQSNIVPECVVPLRPALHDDQPALRSDLDPDPMTGAIFRHGIHEYSLAVEHRYPVGLPQLRNSVAAAVWYRLVYAKKRPGILSSTAGFGGQFTAGSALISAN